MTASASPLGMSLRERQAALVFLGGRLVGIHTSTSPDIDRFTHEALIQLRDEIQSVAWALEGTHEFRERADQGRALWNIRFAWITKGVQQDRHATCDAHNAQGRPCRNRPLVGIDHCTHHATEAEKVYQRARVEAWETHRDAVMDKYEVLSVINTITQAITPVTTIEEHDHV